MHAVISVGGAALVAPEKEIIVIRPVDKVGLDDLVLSVHEHIQEAVSAMYAYRKTFERGNNVRNSNPEVAVALDTKEISDQHIRDVQFSTGPKCNVRLTA